MMGKDHTIFAVEDGVVKFDRSSVRARICVVAEEEYVPTKDTVRARKFAKCVATLAAAPRRTQCASRFRAVSVHEMAHVLMRRFSPCRFPPRNSAAQEEGAAVAR